MGIDGLLFLCFGMDATGRFMYKMREMAPKYNSVFGGFTWTSPPSQGFALLNVTETRRTHDWHELRLVNNDWVLDYFHSAGAKVRVGSEHAEWIRRDAYVAHLYPPGTAYWEDIRQVEGAFKSAWINFRPPESLNLLALTRKPAGFGRFIDPDRQLDALLHEIAVTARAYGDEGYWDTMPPFLSTLNLVGRAIPISDGVYQVAPVSGAQPSHPVVVRIQQYLREHASQRVSESALAKYVCMSISGMIRRYRTETGETPMRTLSRIRIELAKSLLKKGQSLKMVADQFQFYDAFHFSKTFKRVEGVSPSHYVAKTRVPVHARDSASR